VRPDPSRIETLHQEPCRADDRRQTGLHFNENHHNLLFCLILGSFGEKSNDLNVFIVAGLKEGAYNSNERFERISEFQGGSPLPEGG
jgi:hypothetical protein